MNLQHDRRCAFVFVTLVTLVSLSVPSVAHAELAFFTTGRALSIKSHRAEGDLLILQLRDGGEFTIESRLIDRITPDEVPYPEPPAVTESTENDSEGHGGLPPSPSAYDPIIDKVSKEQGVDARLVRAVIQVESAYQQRARSRKGAIGLMQLMPATAQRYAVADPYDPASNIEAGIKHLKGLLDRWPRDLALAAYNAGEATVQRFRGIPPYPETRAYVARILQLVSR
jgi:hypothetical protein